MRAPDGFDMTAVAERAAVVQASLFDDVVHVVDEFGPAIPTRLNIAGGTDVVVGARDMRAVRRPAFGYVSRYLVATLFQQREELLKLAGVGWMHRDVEAIGCLHRHHQAVAIGIDYAVRFTLGCAFVIRCGRGRAKSRTAAIIVTRWRNIILPMTLSSFCRKPDEHADGGKCGDLHAPLRDSPRVRSGLSVLSAKSGVGPR